MALKKVKGNFERMFDKNLTDLVRGIRNNKDNEVMLHSSIAQFCLSLLCPSIINFGQLGLLITEDLQSRWIWGFTHMSNVSKKSFSWNNDLCYFLTIFPLFQAKYIAQCIEEIKLELRQDNINVKCNAVSKLTYVSYPLRVANVLDQGRRIFSLVFIRKISQFNKKGAY